VSKWPSILRLNGSYRFRGSRSTAPPAPLRDGAHDFDFLIGDWKAHVRRLPDRLNGSNKWIEYDGIYRHKKILDSNANFEEFEVDGRELGSQLDLRTVTVAPASIASLDYGNSPALCIMVIRLRSAPHNAGWGVGRIQRAHRGHFVS
jgi:hypothetical protein